MSLSNFFTMITHLFVSSVTSFLPQGNLDFSNLDYELCLKLDRSRRMYPYLKTIMILLLKYLELARLHWSCFVSWIGVWGINTYPWYTPRLTYFGRTSNRRPRYWFHTTDAILATVNIGFFGAIYEGASRIQGRSFNPKPNLRDTKAVSWLICFAKCFLTLWILSRNILSRLRIFEYSMKVLGSRGCKYDELPAILHIV